MSKDIEHEPEDPRPNGIVLVSDSERHWLLEGMEFFDAMLSGKGEFPKPVECLLFENVAALERFLPDGVDVGGLWLINPLIIDRLRDDGVLSERPAPPSA